MYKFKVKDLNKKDKELKKLMKRCTKCKELKLIKKFDKASAKKDGFNQECKECRRNRYFHICIQCGKEFRSGKKENKFCSRKCMGMYSDNKEEVSCDYCGKIFRKRKLKVLNDKKNFCSRECCGEYQKKRITIICEYCKKSFDTVPSKIALHEHHYCSMQCANLANAKIGEKNPNYNPNMTDEEREVKRTYNEYYEWRKQVFERDNYTCQCCGKYGGSLAAHHLNSLLKSLHIFLHLYPLKLLNILYL